MRTVPFPDPGRGPAAYQPALVRSVGVPSGAWPLASRRPPWSSPIRSKGASTPRAGMRRRSGAPTRQDAAGLGWAAREAGVFDVLGVRGVAGTDCTGLERCPVTAGVVVPVGCSWLTAGSGQADTVDAAAAGPPPGRGKRYQRPAATRATDSSTTIQRAARRVRADARRPIGQTPSREWASGTRPLTYVVAGCRQVSAGGVLAA